MNSFGIEEVMHCNVIQLLIVIFVISSTFSCSDDNVTELEQLDIVELEICTTYSQFPQRALVTPKDIHDSLFIPCYTSSERDTIQFRVRIGMTGSYAIKIINRDDEIVDAYTTEFIAGENMIRRPPPINGGGIYRWGVEGKGFEKHLESDQWFYLE